MCNPIGITSPITLIAAIADQIDYLQQMKREKRSDEFVDRAEERLNKLESLLPSGSGIDCGTKIDREASRKDRIVLTFDYHKMNSNGFYCGWLSFKAIITPSFEGFDLRIIGQDWNQVKDSLFETYNHELKTIVDRYNP